MLRPASRPRRIRPPFPAAALVTAASLVVAGCAVGSPHAARRPPRSTTSTASTTTTTLPPVNESSPAKAAASFVARWNHRDWRAMARQVDQPPRDFVAQYANDYANLGATSLKVTAGRPAVRGGDARVPLAQAVGIPNGHHVRFLSTLKLHLVRGRWLVEWDVQTLDRQLIPGEHLLTTTFQPARAGITGAGGVPLVRSQPMVEVGVVGQHLKNVGEVTRLLLAGGATRSEVASALRAAKANPTYFEPVFQITRAEYEQHVKGSALYKVAGTMFQSTGKFQPATQTLGTYLTGSLGPVTAQELRSLGRGYRAGDIVGQGGLEQLYEKRLAGKPGTAVEIVDDQGNVRVAIIDRFPATPGRPVRTSISLPVEQAAESTISGTATPAALVAVNDRTGQVLAMATHDPTPAQNGYVDYALDALEAPGSTFKTVTSTALIADKGFTLHTGTTCPPTRTVDGETFHNYENEQYRNLTLLTAFALSCNTAFVGMATAHLTGRQLVAAARSYRLGIQPEMGFPAYGGSVPPPPDLADLGSMSFGQDQITVSPLDMAMVAADVGSGTFHAPRLVAGAPDDRVPTPRMNPKVDRDLKAMMAAVVAHGTAAGQGLPAGTFAKTGTAEFGSATPQQTHAWLIGFRGHLAFACFVNVGQSGGAVAAPLVARFLRMLGNTHGA